MIEKKNGNILIFYKYLFLAAILFFSLNNTARAEKNTVRAEKLFEIKSSQESNFEQPSNFTIDSNGNIFILDDLKERVVVFSADGKFQFDFGAHTNEEITIYKSYSITIDDYNFLHIFNPSENAVLVLTTGGKLKKTIPLNFDDKLKHKITDFAFSYNNYFLVDNSNNYLYIFDTRGHITKRIGKKGEFQGEFKNPFSMAFDAKGSIYITDVLNSRVQVFATTGTFLHQIGEFGFADGGVIRPNGVAVDNNKNVFISDSLLGIIYVFKTDGSYVSPLGDGDNTLKFKTPTRIKIFRNKLYVLEMLDNKISVYELI